MDNISHVQFTKTNQSCGQEMGFSWSVDEEGIPSWN